jgi:hypothetical protein
MKQIPLTQGRFALVDDADFEWLNQWKWCALKKSNTFYAVRGNKGIRMHRLILGMVPGDRRLADHRNCEGLDNQRHNLRECSHAENSRNARKTSKASSRFKGVTWHSIGKKWQVSIQIDGKNKNLGLYADEIEGAEIYDLAAREIYGEFARLNFPDTEEAFSACG